MFVFGLVLTGGALIGCTEERADVAQIAITTHDFSFEAPSSAPGGAVRITVDNQGTEPHQVELVRVRRGADQDGVAAAVLRMDPAALNSLVTYHGGPNAVPPGEQRTTITELEPGRYVMLCFVAAPDGLLHVHKGMVGAIEITEPEASGTTWSPPQAPLEVELDDYDFVVAGELTPGTHLIAVENVGSEPHELRITSGGPAGGSSTISPGERTWVELVVEPGIYQFTCFVPSSERGALHSQLGMTTTLTVDEPP